MKGLKFRAQVERHPQAKVASTTDSDHKFLLFTDHHSTLSDPHTLLNHGKNIILSTKCNHINSFRSNDLFKCTESPSKIWIHMTGQAYQMSVGENLIYS